MDKSKKDDKLIYWNLYYNNFENFFINFLILIFVIFIFYLSQKNYYGADHDTFAIISSFIVMVEDGYYSPSRSFGNILAEIIFGFLVFFSGAKITSFIVALLFIFSILNFYFAFNQSNSLDIRSKIFFLLCVSNPILLFDNLNIIDFILSLFFFSGGCLLIKKKRNVFGIILLSFAIGCRLNFSAFAVIFLLLYFRNDMKALLNYLVLLVVISSLFYLSIFITNNLSLSFLNNTIGLRYENIGGSSFIIYDQIGRFVYKIIKAFGTLPFFIILIFIFNYLISGKLKKIYVNYRFEFYLILFNLILFFLIPTKTSIISMVMILSYLIIKDLIKRRYLYVIIFLNLLSFFIVFDFLKIDSRHKDPCKAKQAVNASFELNLKKGYLERYLIDSKNNLECSYKEFPKKYSNAYLLQKKLYKND